MMSYIALIILYTGILIINQYRNIVNLVKLIHSTKISFFQQRFLNPNSMPGSVEHMSKARSHPWSSSQSSGGDGHVDKL